MTSADELEPGGTSQQGPGRLFVCAVPIGNLADASPRLASVLGSVDVIACEDTRSTRKLLDLLEISPSPRLLAHHDHNERAGAAGLVGLLSDGHDVALVSDAGTPGVSDPGAAVVDAAHRAGIDVVAVPGPSALAAALSIAGLRADGHRFVGFLPRSAGDIRRLVHSASGDLLVAFESPQRVVQSVRVVAQEQPSRIVALVREISKLHEEVLRGTAGEVADRLAARDRIRGECVLVLAPLAAEQRDSVDPELLSAVMCLVEAGAHMKTACKVIAERCGGSSRALYEAAVAARAGRD